MAKASAKILIIDDEKSIRRTLKEILEYEGYKIEEAEDGMEGMVKIKTKKYDVVFCDIKMPKMDGLEVLANASKLKPDLPIVMISGHATMETAVKAVKTGAFDFIEKPLDLNRLLITVRNALDKSKLLVETKKLRRRSTKVMDIVGESPSIYKIKETIERVAPTDARVFVTGDNGTGKELVARWIHEKSSRKDGPFVEVNCAAIPSELIESELFGHERGSFTSAHKQHIGKFEQANGGTLFLDEIGDMSLSAQAKVLRALQENKISRVGGDKEISVDVRIVSATNKDLLKEVENMRFRLDLYHRLNVIPIKVPSLNDRKGDIPLLANHFIHLICDQNKTPPKPITRNAVKALQDIHWTGNVRELKNIIERLLILSDTKITSADVDKYVYSPTEVQVTNDFDRFENLQAFKEFAEKSFLEYKLTKNSWNVSKTAEEIAIQRSHLYNKMDKYNLKRANS